MEEILCPACYGRFQFNALSELPDLVVCPHCWREWPLVADADVIGGYYLETGLRVLAPAEAGKTGKGKKGKGS